VKNITIKVDEEVARWARIHAAKHGTSVSSIVGLMLRERMLQEQSYEAAHRRWTARRPRALKRAGDTYPRRDELHER
jgi:plasmid stability protein